jgi:hypothetical protein
MAQASPADAPCPATLSHAAGADLARDADNAVPLENSIAPVASKLGSYGVGPPLVAAVRQKRTVGADLGRDADNAVPLENSIAPSQASWAPA